MMTDSEQERLQKYLARAGVASRRTAETLIVAGRVTVNGVVASELGTKVNPTHDEVAVDGVAVKPASKTITLMLHKPAGYVSTMKDPQGRPCVAELVPLDLYPSLYPVGRLDRDTTGLLLFTTDGDLGNLLLHPSHGVTKEYVVLVDGTPNEEALRTLREGVMLSDGMTSPAVVELLQGAKRKQALECIGSDSAGTTSGYAQWHTGKRARSVREKQAAVLKIVIHEGRNRQVRRMCEAVGHRVIALHRQAVGPLALDSLARGSWMELNPSQVAALQQHALH